MPDPNATTDRVQRRRILTAPVPIQPTMPMGRIGLRPDREKWHILDENGRPYCGRLEAWQLSETDTFAWVIARAAGLPCNECHRRYSWRPMPHEYQIVDNGHTTPCKVWTRGLDSFGYPRRGKPEVRPHREMYEQINGPIPEGYVLHHLCGVKTCLEPTHVEAITRAEHAIIHNEERGRGPGGEWL